MKIRGGESTDCYSGRSTRGPALKLINNFRTDQLGPDVARNERGVVQRGLIKITVQAPRRTSWADV